MSPLGSWVDQLRGVFSTVSRNFSVGLWPSCPQWEPDHNAVHTGFFPLSILCRPFLLCNCWNYLPNKLCAFKKEEIYLLITDRYAIKHFICHGSPFIYPSIHTHTIHTYSPSFLPSLETSNTAVCIQFRY